ncbi:UNVERIFIED_CONTAM: hypothetical protein RMT77_006635 [Armadillidium vulgare]
MRHLFYILFLIHICFGKIYKKCELAKQLKYKYRLPKDDIKNWVCIAQYESGFNTAALNKFNSNGSKDYGLFQINNGYWCDSHYGKNICKLPCKALLDNSITDDITCAYIIKKETESWSGKEGYTAWVVYVNHCQKKNLDAYIAECKI